MQTFLNFFFPCRCQLCGDSLKNLPSYELCVACAADIAVNSFACKTCAIPLPDKHTAAESVCADCLKSLPVYDSCWSPFVYAQPLEWMILQLKFNGKLNFARLLSGLMIQRLPEFQSLPDVIIPMPLHSNRQKQRGFNQSSLLVESLAQKLGIVVDTTSCMRVRDTEHQTGKNAAQRRKNIKGAFTVDSQIAYLHVVIFDDVVTTGSSVSELSKELKKAGVQRVDVWCLARAEK